MALYNASHHALRAVSPSLSMGGPATMELMDIPDFLVALEAWGLLSPGSNDFVSTHSYPTDTCNSAPDARTNLDCFTDGIISARQQAGNHSFLITEFNCGWKNDQIHDGESTSYAAAFLFRTVNKLRMHDISALSWWSFSSIFEEVGLPTNEFGPFGANSALQTVHGVALPVYRGFQLLASTGNQVLELQGLNASGPVTVMPTRDTDGGPLRIFLSNFAPDDNKPAELNPCPEVNRANACNHGRQAATPEGRWYNQSQTVRITVLGAAVSATASVRMINSTCANPKQMWVKDMNSTAWPTAEELLELRRASSMCQEEIPVGVVDSGVVVQLVLEPYAAAELVLLL
eukprot:TRINITY_DN6795_c0_g1_i4.p1 TRINITY_DN6795_c0_g1~~TRINITY_DN6795_c0_g1_i4.p1  ORF type:complete len:345 (-),score=57.25 TRINITY_DN6795_c0_g1_i4:273-1307(-)